jgi:RNA polymerase-interacting CarD/CdnL/TRCF family regulator
VIESDRAAAKGMAESSWHVGAAVFCPGRGLGVIVEREVCAPLGTPREYLTITIQRAGMTLKVPVDQAIRAGLRPPADPAAVREALEVLSTESQYGAGPWQARIKSNRVKLSEGTPVQTAEVLRDLAWRATRRPLGMQERDQHRQAVQLLEGQIMQALALDERDARALLAELLPTDPAAA